MLLSPHGALPDPTVQIVSVACGKDSGLALVKFLASLGCQYGSLLLLVPSTYYQ